MSILSNTLGISSDQDAQIELYLCTLYQASWDISLDTFWKFDKLVGVCKDKDTISVLYKPQATLFPNWIIIPWVSIITLTAVCLICSVKTPIVYNLITFVISYPLSFRLTCIVCKIDKNFLKESLPGKKYNSLTPISICGVLSSSPEVFSYISKALWKL